MWVEIALAVLAFVAVVIGVLSQTAELRQLRWRAVNVWGYTAIGLGFLVAGLSVVKSWNDDNNDREQRREISKLSEAISQTPIVPESFVIRVLVNYHYAPDGTFPKAIRIDGNLGKAFYFGELVNTDTQTAIRGGGRGAGYVGYPYITAKLSFPTGLTQYPNVKSIDGQNFTAHFLTSSFPAPPETNLYREFAVDLYFAGYHCQITNRVSDGQYQNVVQLQECK